MRVGYSLFYIYKEHFKKNLDGINAHNFGTLMALMPSRLALVPFISASPPMPNGSALKKMKFEACKLTMLHTCTHVRT